MAAAQAQVTAVSQTVIKQLPAGITPPEILVFDASSVPVLDLQIAADNMTPSEIYNVASNLIRPALVSVPGVAIPAPYGGTQANVEVDLDPAKLLEHGLSRGRRRPCAGDPEHRAAGRRPEDRRHRLHGRDQCDTDRDRQLSTTCRSSRSAMLSSTCATWPMSIAAVRRSRTRSW